MENERNIASAAILIMFLTGIGYVLSLFTQVLIAHYFGVGKELDAFVAAAIIPEFIFGLTNAIFFTSLVIFFPVYVKNKGEEEGKIFFKKIFTICFILLGITILLVIITSPLLAKVIAPGFSEEQRLRTSLLIKLLSPAILFYGLTSLTTGILFYKNKFFASKAFRSIISIGLIVGVLLFQKSFSILSLAFGTIIGVLGAFILQYSSLKKENYTFSFIFDTTEEGIKTLFILSWPLIITSFFFYFNKIIINMIASSIGVGSISILNYAFLLVNVPVILFSESLGTALFPSMTKQVAYDQFHDIKNMLTKAILAVLFIMIPIMSIFFIFNQEIIRIIFERGAFTATSTAAVSSALIFYTIGIIPLSLMALLIGTLNAIKKMKEKMYLFFLFLVTNAFLAINLAKIFSYNGIALGTSITYWIIVGIGFWVVSKKIGVFDYKRISTEVGKIGIASGSITLLLFLVQRSIVKEIVQMHIFLEILILGTVIGVALLLYLWSMKYLQAESAEMVVQLFKKYWRRE